MKSLRRCLRGLKRFRGEVLEEIKAVVTKFAESRDLKCQSRMPRNECQGQMSFFEEDRISVFIW